MSDRFTLHLGDCLEAMRAMPDNSVHSIVTDPPYGLSDHRPQDVTDCLTAWLKGEEYRPNKRGFMGRTWDSWVPGPEVWREAMRVLKPGGHILAFSGSRTMDLMSMAIRLAGFEIRDTVAWCYSQGFPKSMDVSKAIDKLDAAEAQERRRLEFTAWVRSQGVTARQIDEATGTNMGGHYTTAASQPAVMTREHLEACRHLFRDVPGWVEVEADQRTVESENFKRREVVGRGPAGLAQGQFHASESGVGGYGFAAEYDITAPATDAARQWQGWGTSLKPAFEPCIMARKPLVGTVAENVLRHGTGALNIDGCRVGTESTKRHTNHTMRGGNFENHKPSERIDCGSDAGRFPANLTHDGSDEVVALFPDSAGSGGSVPNTRVAGYGAVQEYRGGGRTKHDAGSGSAARFFYTAKVSKRERNEGLPDGVTNSHPCLKPVSLMAYLCRLVTPPGGIVLDPFAGSGSTGKAAMREGFRFVGCEMDPEYWLIAHARIDAAAKSCNTGNASTTEEE